MDQNTAEAAAEAKPDTPTGDEPTMAEMAAALKQANEAIAGLNTKIAELSVPAAPVEKKPVESSEESEVDVSALTAERDNAIAAHSAQADEIVRLKKELDAETAKPRSKSFAKPVGRASDIPDAVVEAASRNFGEMIVMKDRQEHGGLEVSENGTVKVTAGAEVE